MRDEQEIVRAVLAALVRIVATDGARLTVRSYDPGRRRLAVVLSDPVDGTGPDAALIREFLVEVLHSHGIRLDDLIVETDADRLAIPYPARFPRDR